MLILNAGADLISNTITPVMQLLNNVVGVNGVMPMNEAAFAVGMSHHVGDRRLYLRLGFIIHLAVVFLMPKKDKRTSTSRRT